MAWSFRLFEVAGTAVGIHFTFFLLLAWIGASHWMRGGPADAIDGVLFIVVLSCVYCSMSSATCSPPVGMASKHQTSLCSR